MPGARALNKMNIALSKNNRALTRGRRSGTKLKAKRGGERDISGIDPWVIARSKFEAEAALAVRASTREREKK